MVQQYRLLILGGGSAGFAGATRANDNDVKTALINSGQLGGTCVNVGCVPSKYLLEAGNSYKHNKKPAFDGISTDKVTLDFDRIMAGKRRIVEKLRQSNYRNVVERMPHVTLIEGEGRLIGGNRIQVGDKILEDEKILLSVGARPVFPSFRGIDEVDVLTSDDLIEAESIPKSLTVIGGRAVGLEFAQMFSRFGSEVTILQRSERILPDHEPEVSEELTRNLRSEGIEIYTGVKIEKLSKNGSVKSVSCVIDGESHEFVANEILMATGRRPGLDGLGLETAGVETHHGFIKVNEFLQTSNPDIYAAGDCVSRIQLETLAARMGSYAVRNAFEEAYRTIDVREFPRVIFTDPQVAIVGYTEEEYSAETGVCACRTVGMELVPKAQILNDTRGLVKMGINPSTKEVVGANIVAYNAAELIHEATIAYKFKLTIDDIIETPHVFPTMMEVMKKVSHAFYRDPSLMSCCIE